MQTGGGFVTGSQVCFMRYLILSQSSVIRTPLANCRRCNHIGGKRKPMRRIGSHIVALSAAASRPDYRPGAWRFACVMISGGFLSQENQPGQGLTKPE